MGSKSESDSIVERVAVNSTSNGTVNAPTTSVALALALALPQSFMTPPYSHVFMAAVGRDPGFLIWPASVGSTAAASRDFKSM